MLWSSIPNDLAIDFANWARRVAPDTIVCCNDFGCLNVVIIVVFVFWYTQTYNKNINPQNVDNKNVNNCVNNWNAESLTLSFAPVNFVPVTLSPLPQEVGGVKITENGQS